MVNLNGMVSIFLQAGSMYLFHKKGIDEAIEGGKKIKDEPIDIVFTSSLMRAQMTAMLVMNVHHSR